jgi:hypothetical protein
MTILTTLLTSPQPYDFQVTEYKQYTETNDGSPVRHLYSTRQKGLVRVNAWEIGGAVTYSSMYGVMSQVS